MLGILKAGGDRDDRGWDGWMASLTRWTWVWASSRNWWWPGKPGVLQSMGLQSQTRLSDWTELIFRELPNERCRFHRCFMFMIMILLLQGYHFPVRAMKLLHPLRPPSNDLPCLFLLKLEAIIQESRNWVLFSHSISRFAMTPWDIFFLSACFLKCKVKMIFFSLF